MKEHTNKTITHNKYIKVRVDSVDFKQILVQLKENLHLPKGLPGKADVSFRGL